MGSLTNCTRKFSKALDGKDKTAITKLRDELKADGLNAQEAAVEATIMVMDDLQTERKTLADAVGAEAHGLGLIPTPLDNYNTQRTSETRAKTKNKAPEQAGSKGGKKLDNAATYPMSDRKPPTGKKTVTKGKQTVPEDENIPFIDPEVFKEIVGVHDWLWPDFKKGSKTQVSFGTGDRLGKPLLWTKEEALKSNGKFVEGNYRGPGTGKYVTGQEAKAALKRWKEEAASQSGKTHPTRGTNNDKIVLSLFDKTGEWSQPYRDAGYDVYMFDIQSGQDLMDFSVEYFNENYNFLDIYAILAACPCTDFTNAGSKHWKKKDVDGSTEASKELVFQTLRTIEYFRPQVWALENPMGRIDRLTGLPPWRMAFDPHHFGGDYTKKTGIWGNFNPELETANRPPIKGSKIFTDFGGGGLATKNARSETPEGFAYSFFNSNNVMGMTTEEFLTTKYTNIRPAILAALDAGLSEAVIDRVMGDYWDYEGTEAAEELGRLVKDPAALEQYVEENEQMFPALKESTAPKGPAPVELDGSTGRQGDILRGSDGVTYKVTKSTGIYEMTVESLTDGKTHLWNKGDDLSFTNNHEKIVSGKVVKQDEGDREYQLAIQIQANSKGLAQLMRNKAGEDPIMKVVYQRDRTRTQTEAGKVDGKLVEALMDVYGIKVPRDKAADAATTLRSIGPTFISNTAAQLAADIDTTDGVKEGIYDESSKDYNWHNMTPDQRRDFWHKAAVNVSGGRVSKTLTAKDVSANIEIVSTAVHGRLDKSVTAAYTGAMAASSEITQKKLDEMWEKGSSDKQKVSEVMDAVFEPKQDVDGADGGQTGMFRISDEISTANITGVDAAIANMKVGNKEKAAFLRHLESRPDADEILDRLHTLHSTPWAKQAILGGLARQAMDDLVAGKEPDYDNPVSHGGKQIAENIRAKGAEGVYLYMSGIDMKKNKKGVYKAKKAQRQGVIGHPEKPVNAVNGSFLDCDPTHGCATFCYAMRGRYGFANSINKSELITWAVENDPERMAEMIAGEYKNSPEHLAHKALRFFDKGDISESWLPVFKALEKKKIRTQIFSKRPEILEKVSDFHLKMLSIDHSNMEKANEYPDLNVAVVYDGSQPVTDWTLENYSRVSVILPIKIGQKVMDPKEFSVLQKDKRTRSKLCPIDTGSKTLGDWDCTRCDKNGGVGCFHGSVTAKILKAVAAGVESEAEIQNLIEELQSVSDKLPEADRANLLRDIHSLVSKVRAGTDTLAEDTDPPSNAEAGADAIQYDPTAEPGAAAVGQKWVSGQTVEGVNRAIKNVVKNADQLASVHVVQTPQELPEDAVALMSKMGPETSIAGYYNRRTGDIYLVADGIQDAKDAQVTLIHEAIGHMGIEGVMGDNIGGFLQGVDDAIKSEDPVVKAAWDHITSPTMYGRQNKVVQLLETVAYISESDPKHNFVQKIYQWFRQALRKMGIKVAFNNGDITEALARARKYVETGGQAKTGPGGLFQAAYHGSAARHDRFSMDKIGTGEGNAAYGHGLYFAQKQEIAEYYRGEGGGLFQVEIPESDDMLDWDAPLSGQSESVQTVLRNARIELAGRAPTLEIPMEFTGEEIYQKFSIYLGSDKAASEALKKHGLPGLQYFDDHSRNLEPDVPEFSAWAGYYRGADLDAASMGEKAQLRAEYREFTEQEDTRTRNFVLFDDTKIDIVDSSFRAKAWRRQAEEMGFDTFTTYYHGSTHDISSFSTSDANSESDWGPGSYFSSVSEDVSENYAGIGPDITSRIEREQENLEWVLGDGDIAEVSGGTYTQADLDEDYDGTIEKLATDRVAGPIRDGVMYPVHLRKGDFAQVGGGNPTVLTGESPEDLHQQIAEALDYDLSEKEVSAMFEQVQDLIYDGEIEFAILDEAIRDNIFPESDETGMPAASGAMSAQVLRAFGYKGVIDHTVNQKFGSEKPFGKAMEGMEPGMSHVVVFPGSEDSIRSINAEFEQEGADIMFRKKGAPQTEQVDQSRRNFLAGVAGVAATVALGKRFSASLDNLKLGKATPISKAAKTPVNKATEELLRAGDLKGALAELAASGPTELRSLAKKVNGLIPKKGLSVSVDDRSNVNAHGMVSNSLTGGADLMLYTKGQRTGLSAGTILHESLHMAVMARFRTLSTGSIDSNYSVLGMGRPASKEAMDEFMTLWSELKRSVGKGDSMTMRQAVGSPDEFFVRALTDMHLQTELSKLKYDGRSFMDRFKDWVKFSLFNFKNEGTVPSWLDAALLGANNFADAMGLDSADFAFSDAATEYNQKSKMKEDMEQGDMFGDPEPQRALDTMDNIEDQGFNTSTTYYHITAGDFDEFIPGGPESFDDQAAIFFSPNKERQPAFHNVHPDKTEGANVRPVYLKIETPWRYTQGDRKVHVQDWDFGEQFPYIIRKHEADQLKARGYDSVIIGEEGDTGFGGQEIAVFGNDQIRSTFAVLTESESVSADAGKLTPAEIKEWRAVNKVSQRKGRVPEVQQAAKDLESGAITGDQYRDTVMKYMPIMPLDSVPELTTVETMSAALATNKAENLLGVDRTIEQGTRVATRLDIPAYDFYNAWVVTVHDGTVKSGNAIAYGSAAVLHDVQFSTSAKAALGIATGSKAKSPFARIHGDWQDATPESASKLAASAMKSGDWVQVGMNPFRHSYFYDKATGRPVVAAEQAVQVGPLVMAKNVEYAEPESEAFNVKGTEVFFRAVDDQPTSRESVNRRIKEKHHGIWYKAKTYAKRQLLPGGLLPKSVFNAKIERDSKMGATEMDVKSQVWALENAFERDFGKSFDKRTDAEQELMDRALRGDTSVYGDLPDGTVVALEAMRQYIDRQSEAYVEILKADGMRLMAELTPERQQELMAKIMADDFTGLSATEAAIAQKVSLIMTITGNVGQYLHRSYRAFDDPLWVRNIPDDILNAATDYLNERYLEENPDADQAEVDAATTRVIESIVKEGTAFDSMEGMIKESKLGAKDLSLLKRRKAIAPEIRELLGEHKDARVNFAKTATKMTRLIFNDAFLKKVRENGLGTFLFEKGQQPQGHWKEIAGEGNEAFAPLNGLMTTPEINQAFVDALGRENMATWFKMIVQANGMVKFGKTVLSPTTAARNWMSAMFFALGNGHFDFREMGKSFKSVKSYFKHEGDELAYLRKLKELGVVYDTPYAGEMMRLLDDTDMADRMLSGRMKAQHILNFFQKAYQFGDDFWKIIGFENETALQMKHLGKTRAEAEVVAAERIRQTYPTYSMVPRFVNQLRRFPLAGTFVSFPAEIVRTSYNIVKYAAEDMKASKALGMQRVVGLAIIGAAAYAAQTLSKILLGVDDDEEEAVREQLPEWSKNSNLYFLSREGGKLRYIDLSFLDPYNFWKRPITAVMRDEPFKDKAVSAASDMLSPFFGTDIAFGAVSEVLNNKKASGGRVFNEADTGTQQTAAIANHLRKAMQPGAFANAERIIKAARGERSVTGRQYSMEDEMAALVGFRVSTLDPGVGLKYRTFEANDQLRNASSILSRKARDPNPQSEDDLRETWDRVKMLRDEVYDDMLKTIKAARRSGMDRQAITRQLRAGGVSKRDAVALASGRIPRKIKSPSYMKDVVMSARDTYGPEIQAELRTRQRLIMKWSRE